MNKTYEFTTELNDNGQNKEERTMNLYYELVTIKEHIPVSTYKTILGQIISGDIEGAQAGIRRIKEKLRRQAYDNKKI